MNTKYQTCFVVGGDIKEINYCQYAANKYWDEEKITIDQMVFGSNAKYHSIGLVRHDYNTNKDTQQKKKRKKIKYTKYEN